MSTKERKKVCAPTTSAAPHLTTWHQRALLLCNHGCMECPQSVQKSSGMICGPFLLFKSRDNKYTLTNSIDISHKNILPCEELCHHKRLQTPYKKITNPFPPPKKNYEKKNYVPKTL